MTDQFSKNTLRGTLWMLTQKLGAQVTTLLVFIILARVLDAREFGLMAMANVVVLFLSVFASQGLTSAIIQRQELATEHLDSAFWLNLLVGVGMCVITACIAPLISHWYNEPMVATLIWALSVNVILESLSSVQNSILQRQMEFKSIAIRKLCAEIISGVIAIAMAFSGFGVWSLVAKAISSLMIQVVIFWFVTEWRPNFRFCRQHAKEITGYGVNVLSVNVVNFSARQLDDLFVGLLLGATVLGQYSIAKRLVLTAVDVIRGGIGSVAWTMFAKIQDDKARLRVGLSQINQWVCVIAIPLFLGLSLFPEHYIPLLFGEKWLDSVAIIRFLALVGMMESIRSSHESLILAVGKSGLRLKLALLLTFCNFAAFFLLYKTGISSITLGYAVIAGVLFPLWAWSAMRLTAMTLSFYLKSFLQPLAATTLALIVYCAIEHGFKNSVSSTLLFGIEVTLMGLIYLAIIALFNRHKLIIKR